MRNKSFISMAGALVFGLALVFTVVGCGKKSVVDYVVVGHFSGEEGYEASDTAIQERGYKEESEKYITLKGEDEFVSWLLNEVPASKDEVYGVFLVEDTKEHTLFQIEHWHTGYTEGEHYGKEESIPGHFFRSCYYVKK